MLSENELDQTAAQLAEFTTANQRHHATLNEVLQKYAALMDDYKRLRSDYEEERDSRERYKQMARGQERNPFVLVLIDGDGYVFDDDLVSSGAEGGQRAAALLNDAVRANLRNRGLDHCRIMVRVYANLAGLSKALSKVKLAGAEKRSLGSFVASFNRSNDLFDFVDAGELKENADFKLRAMFRQFVENPQCKHIYFAGCHDVGYISELTPYSGSRDRITLVRHLTFHHEFHKLGMRVADLPDVFRTTPLDGHSNISSVASTPLPSMAQPVANPAVADDRMTCGFFSKGLCKYGKGCKFAHVKPNGQVINGSQSSDWRVTRHPSNSGEKFQMSALTATDKNFMSGNSSKKFALSAQTTEDLSNLLPAEESIPPGQVPVNKDFQRLDPYIPYISPAEFAAFKARIAAYKLCNNFHLNGSCPSGDSCVFDHSSVSAVEMRCLKSVNRNSPCQKKGACRMWKCTNGHVCQKGAHCKHLGGIVFCKLSYQVHGQDLALAGYEPASGVN